MRKRFLGGSDYVYMAILLIIKDNPSIKKRGIYDKLEKEYAVFRSPWTVKKDISFLSSEGYIAYIRNEIDPNKDKWVINDNIHKNIPFSVFRRFVELVGEKMSR